MILKLRSELYWIFNYRLNFWKEKAIMAIVWRLPRKFIYWCAIRAASEATTGTYADKSPSEISVIDMLNEWTK